MQESRCPSGSRLVCTLNDHQNNANGASVRSHPDDRLDSWKKIASYLKRDVSTVQRWERREAKGIRLGVTRSPTPDSRVS
jgi:hypothetical protein